MIENFLHLSHIFAPPHPAYIRGIFLASARREYKIACRGLYLADRKLHALFIEQSGFSSVDLPTLGRARYRCECRVIMAVYICIFLGPSAKKFPTYDSNAADCGCGMEIGD